MIVTRLPGVSDTSLLDTLKAVRFDLNNGCSAGTTVHDRIFGYVRWVNDSTRALHGVISPLDVSKLLWTDAYATVMSSLGNLGYHRVELVVGQLVDIEISQRALYLESLIDELQSIILAWAGVGLFVVPDTSYFIKDPTKFDERDVGELVGAGADPVRIVVPIIVLDELDNLKNDRVRGFAQRSLGIFDQLLADPKRPAIMNPAVPEMNRGEVTLELLLDPLGHVRAPSNDEEIISKAVAVQTFVGREIRFVTYDTGQAMRARAAGLHTIRPPLPENSPKL